MHNIVLCIFLLTIYDFLQHINAYMYLLAKKVRLDIEVSPTTGIICHLQLLFLCKYKIYFFLKLCLCFWTYIFIHVLFVLNRQY